MKTIECHGDRDGDCDWKHCPQKRDNEPSESGRHCPLDNWEEPEGYALVSGVTKGLYVDIDRVKRNDQ